MSDLDLIQRTHETLSERRLVIMDRDKRYRYALGISWAAAPAVNIIMLNPSTADEIENDPTITRCQKRAARMGCGAIMVTNLFAWRAADPNKLRRVADPIGPGNDDILLNMASNAALVIAAWGAHGTLHGRGDIVRAQLRDAGVRLMALGHNADGTPKHPLYVPYNTALVPLES